MTFSANCEVNTTVGGSSIVTTLQSSVAYNGVAFTFDQAVAVGFFVTGEPFVVAEQAFQITSISPASNDLQGDGYIGHGAMKDPFMASNADPQGFDGYLGSYPSKTTYETPYSASQNIDPAVSGSISIVQGEKASIVKTVRHASKTSNTVQFQTIAKYVVLTVLDAAPPVGALRPGMAGTTKTIRTRADVDFIPRNIALPASWPTVASIISDVPDNIAPLVASSERRRFFRTDNDLGTTNDGYSGEIIPYYARYVYAVNSSNVSASERQAMADKIITFANDIEAVLDAGGSLGGGAGQGGGIWLWGMAAAALLDDAALLTKIRNAALQVDKSPLWVTSDKVGLNAAGSSGVAAQTYFSEHVGNPWVEPDEFGSHHAARYVHIAAEIVSWEIVSILAFNQGPGAMANGADTILNGGANDNTNVLAAGLNFNAMRRQWDPNYATSYPVTSQWADAWDDLVATGDFTPWAGRPDQPPMSNASALDDDYFSAGSGSITLNTQGIDYATEAITQTDMRYSLDNVQWVEDLNVALTSNQYTKTGLLKSVAHWCGWRRKSTSGNSLWSPNFPYATPITSGSDRSKVTTAGTDTNTAPNYTGGIQPAIQQRLHPAWEYKVWEPAPSTLGVDDIFLAAGVGYVAAGYPAPTYSYQWKRDAVNIAGATAVQYTRVAVDADADLTCEITATNGSGSDVVTTAAVTCPAVQNPPAGTLIDTDFRGAFAIDYESELASISGSNYTVTHEPTTTPAALSGANYGALKFDKTGANPNGSFDIARAATASTIYDITAQLVIDGDTFSDRGDFFLEIKDGVGAVLFSEQILGADVEAAEGDTLLVAISDSFTTAANTALEVHVRWNDATGGASGGDPHLTQFRIAET